MTVQSWTDVIVTSLQNVWGGVIGFLPSLIGALVILIIGLIVAAGLGSLVERVISTIKIDSLLRKLGLGVYFERAGLSINSGKFLGALVYWFLLVVFILAASDILGLWGLSTFLREVVIYIPNIIISVLILLAAVVVANFLSKLVKASVVSAKLHASNFLATITYWVIIIFGILAALVQLGVAGVLLNTIVTGLIAMLAIAGGLAFGLGGKDYAAHLIDRLRQKVEER